MSRGWRPAEHLRRELGHFEAEVWRVAHGAGCTEASVESALQGWGDGAPMPSSAKYVAIWHVVHALKAVRSIRATLDTAASDDEADRIAGYIKLGQGYQQAWTGINFPELRRRLAGLAGRGKRGHVGPLQETLDIIFAAGVPGSNAEALSRLAELADDDDAMDDLFYARRPCPWRVTEVAAGHVVFVDHDGQKYPRNNKAIHNALTKLRKPR